MPDPTFKIDSTTVLSKSGTTVSIADDVGFPSTVFAYVHFSSSPTTVNGSAMVGFTDRTPSTHSSTYGWDLTNNYYRVEKTGVYIISVIIEVNGTGSVVYLGGTQANYVGGSTLTVMEVKA